MNYIKEINSFNEWATTNELSASAMLLWFKLMDRCNRLGWPDYFKMDGEMLRLIAKVKKTAYYAAIDELVAKGRLIYENGIGSGHATFELLSFHQKADTIPNAIPNAIADTNSPDDEKSGHNSERNCGIHIKTKLKHKQETFIDKKEPKKNDDPPPVFFNGKRCISPDEYKVLELPAGEVQSAQAAMGSPMATEAQVSVLWARFKGINASNGSYEGVTGIYTHFKRWATKQPRPVVNSFNTQSMAAQEQEERRAKLFS